MDNTMVAGAPSGPSLAGFLFVTALIAACSDAGSHPPLDAGTDLQSAADRSADHAALLEAGLPEAGTDGGLTASCPVTGFTPCGGDLLGTWRIADLCPEDQAAADALFEHPYDNLAACQDRAANFVKAKWTRNGTLTFNDSNVAIDYAAYVEVQYGLSDACLAAVKPTASTPAEACTALNKPGALSCSYADGLCRCDGTVPSPSEQTSAPYTITDGTVLTIGPDSSTFCRSGAMLVLDWKEHPVSWRYWILTLP